MILFSLNPARPEAPVVVLLGSGLVGASLHTGLLRMGATVELMKPTPWSDADALRQVFHETFAHSCLQGASRIEIIWAAGACGFGASEEQVAAAKPVFEIFLQAVTTLCNRLGKRVRCHLMGSAGGLFEGAGHVSATTMPVPLRPYGTLKLWEEHVLSQTSALAWNVYRLSSVYGPAGGGARLGLVSALVKNTLAHRETLITGRLDTLRDYVWVHDIAAYVLDEVCWGARAGERLLLASGRPSSIGEILMLVARLCRRKPVIRCVQPDNAAHITFAQSALAPGFQASPMAANITSVLRAART